MSRRLKIVVAALVVAVVLVAAGLWALPEIARRVAVSKLTLLTGRQTSIERVELNLFTGRFAVSNLRMARRPGHGPEAFVEFERLAGRVALSALTRFDIRLAELSLARPAIRITRTGPAEFDFADLLELFAKPVAKEEPSRFTFSIGRVDLTNGLVEMDDAFLDPKVQWRMEDLGVEVTDVTTRPGQPPGALRVGAKLGDATLAVTSRTLQIAPVDIALDVALGGFDLARVRPYLPPTVPALPDTGRLTVALKLDRVRTGDQLSESSVSGDVRIEQLAVAPRGGSVPFLRAGTLAVALERMDFLAKDIRLAAIEIDGLAVKAARDKQGAIDLLALLVKPEAPAPAAAEVPATPPATPPAASPATPADARGPPAEKTLPRVHLAKLAVRSSAITFTDEAVSPGREWTIDDVTIDGSGFSTIADDPPGKLALRARMVGKPGSSPPATIAVDADSVRAIPLAATARVTLGGFALATVRPYWPETLPAVVPEGTVGVALDVGVAQDAAGQLTRAIASGSARLDGLRVVQRGRTAPFVKLPKLTVALKQADALARRIDLGAVELEGADLRVVREAGGQIDLLALAPTAEPAIEVVKSRTGLAAEQAAPPPPPKAAAAADAWTLNLDRFAFGKGTLTFEDREVSPAVTLTVGDVAIDARRIAWPFTKPATFSLALAMPGGGRTDGKGTAMLEPLNVQIQLSTREAPITPYQSYFPFAAQLSGFFSGDSLSEVQRGPKGELILASRGTAWASNLGVRAPGASDDVARMDAMVIRNIDFSWPSFALVDRVVLTHPQVTIEREADGAINLRSLFTPRPEPERSAPPATVPPAPATTAAADTADEKKSSGDGGPMQTMVIDFNEISIEAGFARFVDKTTKPPFSEDVSRLALTIKGLSNVMGRAERTTLTAQALIGKDGALDMRGDLSGLGETMKADLVAELRDFALSSANPYAESLTSWQVQRGTLQAKIHYHLEGDRLTAQHDLDFKKIAVAKSTAADADEAKRKIGVPLGLAIALLKDSNGDIDFQLPLSGTLSDKNFDWGETIWAGVKQVLVKVLLSPFNAIGRLMKGSDDSVDGLAVDPLGFGPGSAVVAPSAEAQLGKIAEFLRRSPNIKLSLAPVTSAADLASLKEQAVTARVEAFRDEQRLPDLPSALKAWFKQHLPDVTPPKTVEEQIALLVEREPEPEARVADLAARRVEATRDALVKGRGIPEARLVSPSATTPAAGPPAPDEKGQGRVEFAIVAADG